jgi:hypothetical protein
LRSCGVDQQQLDRLDAGIVTLVNESVQRARLDPLPEFDLACADVYAQAANAGFGGRA